jgi:hypothetical protein
MNRTFRVPDREKAEEFAGEWVKRGGKFRLFPHLLPTPALCNGKRGFNRRSDF